MLVDLESSTMLSGIVMMHKGWVYLKNNLDDHKCETKVFGLQELINRFSLIAKPKVAVMVVLSLLN